MYYSGQIVHFMKCFCLYFFYRTYFLLLKFTLVTFDINKNILLTDQRLATTLQKAQVNIQEPQNCFTTLTGRTNEITELRKHQICAGDSKIKSDTCEGDSGGALVQTFGDRKTIIGITSFGPPHCNSERTPAVYTNVSAFIDWIEERVKRDFNDLENELPPDVNPRMM